MSNNDIDLDELMTGDFLDSLAEESQSAEKENTTDLPVWIEGDEKHTTYRAWQAILQLKAVKELDIKKFGQVATSKTPKSLYSMSKSEVAKRVGISAQSIFRTSSFSSSIVNFFNATNVDLLEIWELAQKKQINRHRKGIRAKSKDEIRQSHQVIEKQLQELRAKTTKDILDLALENMPLDLRSKLGL
ncbi:hypothetical protein L1D55_25730 [Vibrio sp. Isolate22]|uniref:hypothetical protein n=1 Tax=Vibrio sp. Isolate22 TaxID=2908532 RepID=UPI001EFE7172|nr:hypothetical protein [Vibrio sp. Isolate22]MCG9695063.1 hypothetical protein [Vibrio sp. Isolate22]